MTNTTTPATPLLKQYGFETFTRVQICPRVEIQDNQSHHVNVTGEHRDSRTGELRELTTRIASGSLLGLKRWCKAKGLCFELHASL